MIVMGREQRGGGWVTKIVVEKIKPTFLIFWPRFLSPIKGPAMITMEGGLCGWLSDENRGWKIENVSSIFSSTILIAGPSNSWHCVFVQHFWESKIFKNVWRRRNIANSRVLRLWWGGGVVGWRKFWPKKIKHYEVSLLFFDVYQHLAELDDETNRPCLMR